jgi:hypothetical protein
MLEKLPLGQAHLMTFELIRLTYIEEFASAATFDIAYSSELDFQDVRAGLPSRRASARGARR